MIEINTDRNLLNVKYIQQFLSNTYWANKRTLKQVQESINNSLCFGIYLNKIQIGFARIVTDKVVFSYLMDVFIDKEFQSKNYGKILLSEIYKHNDLVNVRSHYLITKDAQDFYSKFGFEVYQNPDRFMLKR